MQTVLITGGTGLIGKALTIQLQQAGYHVIILTRNPDQYKPTEKLSYAKWDPAANSIAADAIEQADHIIHLAGAGVADKRWSDSRKKEILESRVQSSALLVKALQNVSNKVQTVISASAIGWYTPTPNFPEGKNVIRKETDPADDSFLGATCAAWEKSISPVKALGKRLVILRTGIVLANEGGAYAEFKKPLQYGVAAILASGKQCISWIHIQDMCRIYIAALENNSMEGIYNAVAPDPVSNKELTLTIARALKGNKFIPMHVPAFVLKMMLGEMSVEILKSVNVSARALQLTGFRFLYSHIDEAVDALSK